MLNRSSPLIAALISAILATSLPLSTSADAEGEQAEESIQTACAPCWFNALGLAVRGGYAFQESALGRQWFGGGLVGPELLGEIFVHGIHRVVLSSGYLKFYSFSSKGSEEVSTTASYQRADLSAGYEINWKLLVAGIRLGGAWTIVETRTSMGKPGWYVEDEQVHFTPPIDPEVSSNTGATFGFLAGLGVGLAFGESVFGIEDLVEIRVQSDYVRRGPRDDFTVFGSILFWPTRLFR